MNRFIFGFQRRVWWPKWTPASSNSFMETTGMDAPFFGSISLRRRASRGNRVMPGHRPPRAPHRVGGTENAVQRSAARVQSGVPTVAETSSIPLETLGADMRRDSWTLSVQVVEEGLRDELLASLARLAPAAQLGDMATFIAELGREIAHPDRDRIRASGPLADVARGHAHAREALGFGPREVVTEFMVMRRVLQRYLSAHSAALTGSELLEVEERLNDLVDRLTVECVGAYFDRAVTELSDLARRDSLTG